MKIGSAFQKLFTITLLVVVFLICQTYIINFYFIYFQNERFGELSADGIVCSLRLPLKYLDLT